MYHNEIWFANFLSFNVTLLALWIGRDITKSDPNRQTSKLKYIEYLKS